MNATTFEVPALGGQVWEVVVLPDGVQVKASAFGFIQGSCSTFKTPALALGVIKRSAKHTGGPASWLIQNDAFNHGEQVWVLYVGLPEDMERFKASAVRKNPVDS